MSDDLNLPEFDLDLDSLDCEIDLTTLPELDLSGLPDIDLDALAELLDCEVKK